MPLHTAGGAVDAQKRQSSPFSFEPVPRDCLGHGTVKASELLESEIDVCLLFVRFVQRDQIAAVRILFRYSRVQVIISKSKRVMSLSLRDFLRLGWPAVQRHGQTDLMLGQQSFRASRGNVLQHGTCRKAFKAQGHRMGVRGMR